MPSLEQLIRRIRELDTGIIRAGGPRMPGLGGLGGGFSPEPSFGDSFVSLLSPQRGRGGKAGGLAGVMELPEDLLAAPVDSRRAAQLNSAVLVRRILEALRRKRKRGGGLSEPLAPDDEEPIVPTRRNSIIT